MNSVRRNRLKKSLFNGTPTQPCCYCGRLLTFKKATLEHLIQRSKGGKQANNLAIACRPCNNYRGNYSVEEWKKIVCSPGFDYDDFKSAQSIRIFPDTYVLMYACLLNRGRLLERKYLK